MAWTIDGEDFNFRQAITVNSSQVTGTPSGFTLLLSETEFVDEFLDTDTVSENDPEVSTAVKSGGGDIRICTADDGTGRVAIDVITCTPASDPLNAIVKIAVDSSAIAISSSGDVTFYVFWGNSDATQPTRTDTYGRDNAYDTSFKARLPLEEDPSGTAPQMTDRTVNDNHGTSSGSMTSGDLITAQVHDGLDLDGSNDSINLGDVGKPANYTYALWINPDIHDSDVGFIAQCDSLQSGATISGIVSQGGNLIVWLSNDSTTQEYNPEAYNNTNHPTGTWTHIAATIDGSNVRYYRNGTQIGSTAQTITNSGTVYNCTLGQLGESNSWYFNGQIDEAIIMDSAMSADWIATLYAMQNDPGTFYTSSAFTDGVPTPGGGGSTVQRKRTGMSFAMGI